MKCYDLKITPKVGDSKRLLFQWKCSATRHEIKKFEVIPYYFNGKNSISQKAVMVSIDSWMSGGYYYCEYTAPSPAVAMQVRFQVVPWPNQFRTSGWIDGVLYEWDQDYWTGYGEFSKWVTTPEYNATTSAKNTAAGNGASAKRAAESSRTSARSGETFVNSQPTTTANQKRFASKKWGEAANHWANCAKSAQTASEQYAKASAAAKALGESASAFDRAKAEMDALKKSAEDARKAAEKKRDDLVKEAAAQEAREKKQSEEDAARRAAAAAKRKQRDSMMAKADSAWNDAVAGVNSGNSYYSSRSYGQAKAYYATAAAKMSDAAYWYGEAVAYALDDDDKREMNQRKSKANEWKSTATSKERECAGFVEAQAALAAQQQAVPAKPSVTYERGENGVCMDIDCSAIWSTELRVYRETDGDGRWKVVHTFKRTLAKGYNASTGRQEAVGAAWTRQRWCDRDMADGRSYRYHARAFTASGTQSDQSGYSQPFATKPTPPQGLWLSLLGYDSEGKADVAVNWSNTSSVATEIEVQHTYWSASDAWEANALDKIKTAKASSPEAMRHTLTGVEPGQAINVRVRAVNAAGGAWALTRDGASRGARTARLEVPVRPEPPVNVPSGLKAALAVGSTTSVTLTWSDTPEEGTVYTVQHSANPEAWNQNAIGDITSVEYEDAGGGQGGSKTYTVTGLAPGRRYFRVRKAVGERRAWAEAAAGAGRVGESMCMADVPEPVATTVEVPSGLTATKVGDTAVMLAWTDQNQREGETYEAQYADYPNAFDYNAVGDIRSTESDERTASASKRLTLTGLERGRTWYVRVRKKAEAGASAWSQTASAALPAPEAETIRQPAGLRLEAAGTDRITATWTDSPEQGATYTLRVAPSMRAYANNALGEITEYEYDPAESASDVLCQYEFTGLEPGRAYYVQAVKKKGELRQRAKAAYGPTQADGFTAFLELPAVPVPSITVPAGVTAEPRSADGVLVTEGDGGLAAIKVSWRDQQAQGETYEVSYTDDAEAFADNAIGYIQSLEFEGSGGSMHTVTATGLERGRTWYFRVRKKSDQGQGAWSSTASCLLEAEPEPAEQIGPPTISETLGAYAADDDISLAWTHNSAQDSQQSGYQIEVTVTPPGGAPSTAVVEAQEPTAGNVYAFDVLEWGVAADGSKVEWRVRTCGAEFKAYGPWSRTQSFRVYARPAASVSVDADISAYPFEVAVFAESSGGGGLSDENAPMSYTVEIAAAESYETQSTDGARRYVAEGEVLFSRSLDTRDAGFSPQGWRCAVEARDVYLVGGRRYTARGTVVTVQGMRSQAEAEFSPTFDAEVPEPGATVLFDERTYTCTVSPYCGAVGGDGGQGGEQDAPEWVEPTEGEREALEEWPSDGLHLDFTDGATDAAFSAEVETRLVEELREGTELAVYRVAPDGSTVEIASGMPNDGMTSCVDPHPFFGTCTYRIVATDVGTGVQSSYEAVAETKVDRIVVQWDEAWADDGLPTADMYVGSRLELEHNVESSEAFAPDAALRAYAGRSHPVSYYGTQMGQTAKLSGAFVEGFEDESMALFRKLASWRGDCYVRTPSGAGFWASVRASLSSPKDSRTATATIEATRVDGGK